MSIASPAERDVTRRRMPRAMGSALLLGCLWGAAQGCGPAWYIDPGFAERLAREENKPLLFYFKAWDSAQHRNMKLNVLEDPAVKKELMDTVNVELEFAFFPDYQQRFNE